MLMIDPKLIRTRLQLEDLNEVNDVLKSSILGATPRLEALLKTTFDKGSAEDYFFVGPEHSPKGGSYRFLLAKGFLCPTPARVVSVGDSAEALTAYAGPVVFDDERGFMSLMDSPRGALVGKFIKVTYDYGFLSQKEVPAWLQEVFVSYAARVVGMVAVNDKKAQIDSTLAFVDTHAAGILDAHLRTGSFLIPSVI